jgi:ATP-binding protein involved in chromosome partitioning
MSYFECAHGERYHLFGNGGGEALAERYGVPFLGAVPISMSIREGGDLGIPVVVSQPESLQARALSGVAGQVAAQVSIGALKAQKALPVLKMTR